MSGHSEYHINIVRERFRDFHSKRGMIDRWAIGNMRYRGRGGQVVKWSEEDFDIVSIGFRMIGMPMLKQW